MVHGTTYTVRYVIKLSKEIDYYDILLPICSANRKMFELIHQNEQLPGRVRGSCPQIRHPNPRLPPLHEGV